MPHRSSVAAVLALVLSAAGVGVPASARAYDASTHFGLRDIEPMPDGVDAAAVGDVTGDGRPELVRLFRRGAGAWRLHHIGQNVGITDRTTLPGTPGDLALGDLDGDGDVDALVALDGAYRHAVQLNDGTGTLAPGVGSPRSDGEAPTGPRMRLADADGDGDLDALRLDPATGTLALLRNDGTGAFAIAQVLTIIEGAHALATGDLTGDGRPDAAVGTADGVVVVRNDGAGGVAGLTPYAAGPRAEPLVADVTGDGVKDLVAATGEAVVAYAGPSFAARTTLLPFGAYSLAESRGRLAGLTEHGPFLATRDWNGYQAMHSAVPRATRLVFADLGSGASPAIVFGNASAAYFAMGETGLSFRWDGAFHVVNAGQSVRLVTGVRNARVPVDIEWQAADGTVAGSLYTAPASAAAGGTRIALSGHFGDYRVSGTVEVHNRRLRFAGLAGLEVRGFGWRTGLSEPYYATDGGVFARVPGSSPEAYELVGTTGTTGTDAREVAALDGGVLVARFGSSLFRREPGGDWVPTGPAGITDLASHHERPDVYAIAGSQVWRGAAGGSSWAALGGTGAARLTMTPSYLWVVDGDGGLHRSSYGSDPFTFHPVEPTNLGLPVESVHAASGSDVYAVHGDEGTYRKYDGVWARTGLAPGVVPVSTATWGDTTVALRPGTSDVRISGGSFYDPASGGGSLWMPLGLPPGTAALSAWAGNGFGDVRVGTRDGLYKHVDTAAPLQPQVVDGPSGVIGPVPMTFTFANTRPSEPAVSYLCVFDVRRTPCTSPVTYPARDYSRTYTFAVVAVDEDGNESSPYYPPWQWTVDATPPAAPEPTGPRPAERTRETAATFAFTLPEGSARCSLDGAAPVACASPVTYSSLGDGAHTFAVRAYDAVGNASPAVTHEWTVDATPPRVPVLTAAPPAATALPATFAFTADGADTTTCAVDGGAPEPCESPVTYELGEGPHTFAVRALDDLGNPSAPATHSWTVDTSRPSGPAIVTAPPAVTGATSATFTWQGEGGSYECSLDAAPHVPCASGETYTGLAEGPHTFAVREVDGAGNRSDDATHAWTVDLTAPVATIAPPATTLLPAISVTLGEPGTVALTLTTGTTNVPATTTATTLTPVAPLVPGQVYTVTATATDAYGNVAAPATRTFRAPVSQQETSVAAVARWRRVSWAGAKGGWYATSHTRGSSASFAFTGTSVTWHSVRGPSSGLADVYVDGVLKASRVNLYARTAGTASRTFGGLTNAPHTIRIVARGERGGGTGAEVAVDAFTAGGTLHASPVVTWSWARTGSYAFDDAAGATLSMTFRGRGVSWVTVLGPNMGLARVSVDGVVRGTFDNWSSTTRYGAVRTIGGLSDGVHTVTITVLGQRRSGATGAYVAVDRLDARI